MTKGSGVGQALRLTCLSTAQPASLGSSAISSKAWPAAGPSPGSAGQSPKPSAYSPSYSRCKGAEGPGLLMDLQPTSTVTRSARPLSTARASGLTASWDGLPLEGSRNTLAKGPFLASTRLLGSLLQASSPEQSTLDCSSPSPPAPGLAGSEGSSMLGGTGAVLWRREEESDEKSLGGGSSGRSPPASSEWGSGASVLSASPSFRSEGSSDARSGGGPASSPGGEMAGPGRSEEGAAAELGGRGRLLLELMRCRSGRTEWHRESAGVPEPVAPVPPEVYLVRPLYPACAPTVAFCRGGPEECRAAGFERLEGQRPAVKFVGIGNNAVKSAFKLAGFRKVSSEKWDALWSGGALKAGEYSALHRCQKVNHYPGTWELGRKDKLYRHIAQARRRHRAAYDFLPNFFLLPEELKEWSLDCERHPDHCYILKPRNLSRGRGIKVVRRPADLKKVRECLVQRYLLNPHLINGYKYDLRLYVVVTCWDPLRVYLYKEGLVRFATEKYRTDSAGLKKRLAHITNTSVNSKSKKFVDNNEADEDGVGSKWSLFALERYYLEQGLPFEQVWAQIKDMVVKTLIAVEAKVNTACQVSLGSAGSCYELYGFDVLVDAGLRPWLLEVNTGPALHCPTPLDKRIKHSMVTDMLHLVGFVPHCRSSVEAEDEERKAARLLGLMRGRPTEPFAKRRDVNSLEGLDLSTLTGADAPLIVQEGESENARRGGFERLLPTKDSARYAQLFESQRYYNVLYSKWLQHQHSPPLTTTHLNQERPKSPSKSSGRLSAPASLLSSSLGTSKSAPKETRPLSAVRSPSRHAKSVSSHFGHSSELSGSRAEISRVESSSYCNYPGQSVRPGSISIGEALPLGPLNALPRASRTSAPLRAS